MYKYRKKVQKIEAGSDIGAEILRVIRRKDNDEMDIDRAEG